MRRVDLMEDPRFSSAAARRLNFGALHQIIQSWMLTFPDMATLDAQFDEAKIAMGEIRSTKELIKSEWSEYWGAVQHVSDRSGGEYRLPGRPWHFSGEQLTPIGTPAFQGEHNDAVFSELGISEKELSRLTEAGVLVAHPRASQPEPSVKASVESGHVA
jgi:crotonobetainyl-CoA:carnitine CoA-transferase CaiB-like acyl-CoA transferase